MILVISWAMMLNIAKLIRDRMIMQNKADNIALSLATQKARVYNFLGGTNYLMGMILSLGMNPRLQQLPSYSTNVIGGLPATMISMAENPLSDVKHRTAGNTQSNGVEKIKAAVKGIQAAQTAAMYAYGVYYASVMEDNISSDYNIVVLPLPSAENLENPEQYFGLKKNSKGIQYYKTINLVCVDLGVHLHLHTLGKKKFGNKEKYSWLVEGEDMHEQKIAVIMRKKSTRTNNPLFMNLLDIKYPEVIVFSAAAAYNTRGTMFPAREDTFTGATLLTASAAELSAEWQLALFALVAKNAVSFGPYGVAAAIIAIGGAGINYEINQISNSKDIRGIFPTFIPFLFQVTNKNNPISAYEEVVKEDKNGRRGGWAAHLVPFKTTENN